MSNVLGFSDADGAPAQTAGALAVSREIADVWARLSFVPPWFRVAASADGLLIAPMNGGVSIGIVHVQGRYSLAFNEVPVDAYDAEEVVHLVRLGVEGKLRVVTKMKGLRVVAASLELKVAEGNFCAVAGYGRLPWFNRRAVGQKIACNGSGAI